MSIFQKPVDALIRKELENIKKNKKEEDAKAICKKRTTQLMVNEY